jgi:hypothetical protein
MKINKTDLDSQYFKRVSPESACPSKLAYDADIRFCSSHDHLVSMLMANKMYYAYVRKKLSVFTLQ